MNTAILDTVTSRDGTPIAFYRSGKGSPLILVSGAGAANPTDWTVFPALAEHFTVYAVDRRGHKESGDGLGKPVYPEGFIDLLEALLGAGDREGVLATFYQAIAGMS